MDSSSNSVPEVEVEQTTSAGGVDDAAVDSAQPPDSNISSNDQSDSESTVCWLRRSDRLVAGSLMAICLLLLLEHWVRISRWGAEPVEVVQQEPHSYEFRLDVNSATWLEFTLLEGIGETLAKRIVEDREANGPYESVDELQRVKGIGPKTVEKLRPWLRVSDEEEFTSSKGGY